MGLLNMHKTFMEAPEASPTTSSSTTSTSSPKQDSAPYIPENINISEETHHIFVDDEGKIQGIPKMKKVETFEEKLYRKFSEEPLVPIGCLVTAYFLGSGIKSFFDRDMRKSQKMMRARVAAQGATILVFIGYAGWNSFSFSFGAPPTSKDDEKETQ